MIVSRTTALAIIAMLVLLFGAADLIAATQATNYKHEVGLGGQVVTNPTTATFLVVPAGATHAWIAVKTQPVCWSAGVAAPTATSGGEWPAGALIKIDNDPLFLRALRIINCAEGATTVKVYYSRDRRVGDAQ